MTKSCFILYFLFLFSLGYSKPIQVVSKQNSLTQLQGDNVPSIKEDYIDNPDKHVFFLVVAGGKVVGEYGNIEEAKDLLNTFPSGAHTPSRLILEVVDGIINKDPHKIDGQNQGRGVAAGFNKYWNDWHDIKKMIAVAGEYLKWRFYLVVAGGKVIGEFEDIEDAKEALKKFPPGTRRPSRLVLEVVDGIIQKDPHTVGGQNQGLGVEAGFNKFWWDWHDIKKMIVIAQKYVDEHGL